MPKTLIIGPAWVGDMIMAQCLFRVIKQNDPEGVIDVLAPAWTKALLSRMPEVRRTIEMPIKHGELALGKRWAIAKSLKTAQYDQAIILPNSFKSALIPWFARIPKRVGYAREGRSILLTDARKLDKAVLPLMIERFMALGLPKGATLPKPYPYPNLVIDETQRDETLKTLNLLENKTDRFSEKPILALCPGAEFGWSKRWPPEYYAEVAKAKLAEGYQVWLFGAKNDVPIAEKIQSLTHQACQNLCGKTSLDQALDLLSLADVVVSNDSGLMHMAAALNRRVIAVYGSTSPKFTPPLGEQVTILQLNLPCQPCFQRECPLKHWRCMKDLTPNKVLSSTGLSICSSHLKMRT